MNEIEVIVDSGLGSDAFTELGGFCRTVLEKLDIDDWQMGLLITDDEGITEYNSQWRGMDRPTDVLSFVQDDGEEIPRVPGTPKEAGDIIISLETVKRNAGEWNTDTQTELRRVLIHGILHLMGMDHPGDDYESGMLKLQEELLESTWSGGNSDADGHP